jgi:hypothetical protein
MRQIPLPQSEYEMSLDPQEFLIMALSKPNFRVKKRVEAKATAGDCLGVEFDEQGKERNCSCKAKKRGLCIRCYTKFYNRSIRMSPEKAVAYESKLLRLGRLLKRQETRKYKRQDVYDREAS